MVEDPSLETIDTYSDWEYYSDDYYDDEPTITTHPFHTEGITNQDETGSPSHPIPQPPTEVR